MCMHADSFYLWSYGPAYLKIPLLYFSLTFLWVETKQRVQDKNNLIMFVATITKMK